MLTNTDIKTIGAMITLIEGGHSKTAEARLSKNRKITVSKIEETIVVDIKGDNE